MRKRQQSFFIQKDRITVNAKVTGPSCRDGKQQKAEKDIRRLEASSNANYGEIRVYLYLPFLPLRLIC
jgi:hypothetical protein